MRLRRQAMRGDAGFTLVELAVAMVLFGVVMSIAFFGWKSWARSLDESGTARDIASTLRNAEQRAVSEGATYCVHFDATSGSWTVYKYACDATGTKMRGPVKVQGAAALSAPTFDGPSGNGPDAYFYSRGSASGGTVIVTRAGSSKTYTVRVEGLTGRASISSP